MTLFYDSHVAVIGTEQAQRSDFQHLTQAGYGLWSRDTPFGGPPDGGYFMGDGYDTTGDELPHPDHRRHSWPRYRRRILSRDHL